MSRGGLSLHTSLKELKEELTKAPETFFEVHLGTVVSEETNGTCTVTMQGLTDQISGVRKLITATPTGSVVTILRMGPDWLIIGCLADRNLGGQGEILAAARVTSPANIGNAVADVMGTGDIPTFSLQQNRIIRVEFHHGAFTQNTAGGNCKCFLTDGSNTQIGMFAQLSRATNDRGNVSGWLRFVTSTATSAALTTIDATSPIQLKVRASTDAAGGTVTFAATNGFDPGPMWLRVIDEGGI